MKTIVVPPPIVHPHHHQDTENWIPQLFHVSQTEYFRGLTVIGPKLIVIVQVLEDVVLPTQVSLKRIVILLSRKDQSMEMPLGNLKGTDQQLHH